MDNILTPLQALVALLGECEKSLDRRPSFRKAMAEGYTAALNPRPAGDALMQSLTIDANESDESIALDPFYESMRRAGAVA